jgi:hypothetical protein
VVHGSLLGWEWGGGDLLRSPNRDLEPSQEAVEGGAALAELPRRFGDVSAGALQGFEKFTSLYVVGFVAEAVDTFLDVVDHGLQVLSQDRAPSREGDAALENFFELFHVLVEVASFEQATARR